MHLTLTPKLKSSPPTQTFSKCFTIICTKHLGKMNSIHSSWFVGVALVVAKFDIPASAFPKASLFEVLQTTTAKSKVGLLPGHKVMPDKGSIISL